jgi:hypothetical protein
VPNAQVTIWESDRKARTNSSGAFALDSLPSGTHFFEAIALGYTPFRTIVHLAPEQSNVTNVTLSSRATELARVTVTATYSRQMAQLEHRLGEFERHKTRGMGGYFLSPAEIERRPGNTSPARLIQGMPGVAVRCTTCGCEIMMTEARGPEGCSPTVYLDGRRSIFSASDLDLMLQARDILAIEVYSRAGARPIEYVETRSRNGCGALGVWTKPMLRR